MEESGAGVPRRGNRYAPSLRNLYTGDDSLVLRSEPQLREPHLWTFFDASYFARYNEDTYRPVVTVTYMVDYNVGLDPIRAGHVQNLLWHAAAALMVTLLAARLLPAAFCGVGATAAGIFFAIHPVATEAALSVGFREDVIAACLSVASLCLALSSNKGRRAGALVLYALALFSKENAAVVPALLFLFRVTKTGGAPRRARSLIWELVPYALVTAIFLWVRFGLMAMPGQYADHLGGSRAATMVAVPRIFAHYLRLLVVPWPLIAQYAHMFPLGASFVSQLPWLVLDLAFVVGIVRLIPRHPLIGIGLLWFTIALTPMLHFIPIRFEAADRFMYLPLAGAALSAGALVGTLYQATADPARRARRSALWATCGAAALVLVALTELRIPVWHDNLALWTDTLKHNPRSYTAHFFMFQYFRNSSEARRARAELEAAIASCPHENAFGRARFCGYYVTALGYEQMIAGDLTKARASFTQGLVWDPRSGAARIGLGWVAARQGNLSVARAYEREETSKSSPVPEVQALLRDLRAEIARAEAKAGNTDVSTP